MRSEQKAWADCVEWHIFPQFSIKSANSSWSNIVNLRKRTTQAGVWVLGYDSVPRRSPKRPAGRIVWVLDKMNSSCVHAHLQRYLTKSMHLVLNLQRLRMLWLPYHPQTSSISSKPVRLLRHGRAEFRLIHANSFVIVVAQHVRVLDSLLLVFPLLGHSIVMKNSSRVWNTLFKTANHTFGPSVFFSGC